METLLNFINSRFLGPAVPALLLASGLLFGLRTRFFHLTHIPTILRSLTDKTSTSGGQSPIRSMTVALAGTLGVGNIVGVASAIFSGGAGAIFWMWIAAILSMPIKYAEVVLAVRHRQKNSEGRWIGGAMYCMKNRTVGGIFAFLCILASFSIGNLMQIGAVCESCRKVFGVPPIALGITIAIFLYFAIRKGIGRITALTSFLVPAISLLYILLCLLVILPRLNRIPEILTRIIADAFTPNAAFGGIGGFLLMRSLRFGVSRGLISNESGCGTAPIAHASADTDSPVRQGFWGIFEVFADTILLCSLTAFVILLSSDLYPGMDGMELVLSCFERYLGPVSGYLLIVCVLFFGVATMVGWSYYGSVSLGFLSKDRPIHRLYILLYALVTVPGALLSSRLMWQITDLIIGLMTLINTTFLLTRLSTIGRETDQFFRASIRIRKSPPSKTEKSPTSPQG